MKSLAVLLLLVTLPCIALASVGDNLPEFQACLHQCDCMSLPLPQPFVWSCLANCNYHCQQNITDQREARGLDMVQFYGKWPFVRVFGVQEFFSTVFSLANLYVNYGNIAPIYRQYRRNSALDFQIMYGQYLFLLAISCVGWTFSSLFHFKDTPATETLDYFGAFAIILCNLNVIVVRVFRLFRHRRALYGWHLGLITLYVFHVTKLKRKWDYAYNTQINMAVGVTAMVLWCYHLWRTYRAYHRSYIIYNNSIQLLPHETKLLQKLSYVSLSNTSVIPLVPILNNLVLIGGISLEVNDFPPIQRLIDAHALWHLFTIFPSFIWFDWNIWDLEMLKITEGHVLKE
ncbi:Protein PER1 [Candida viswanathii]|uniref:Post-GPI attachment to proteins factor 3 n=1 Tax=Candida viswanathii TaxID=5486 RepID=A0A367YGH4_9ASCO|nr:Protein PER1 [Candida viswanathii]